MSDRIVALTVPQLGLTMKKGTVAAWHVAPGVALRAGDPVFDIETEKVSSECAAPCAGVLRRQVAPAGTTLAVGELVGVIAPPDIDEAQIDRFVATFEPDQRV